MAWKDFAYSASFDFEANRTIHQPTLKVRLSAGQLSFPTRMLVDSGAQDTLVHADIAPILGIELLEGKRQKIGGVTGTGVGYIHRIHIEIEELGDSIPVDAIFVPKLGTDGILGQTDFFTRYDIKFEKRRLLFSLSKIPKLKFEK